MLSGIVPSLITGSTFANSTGPLDGGRYSVGIKGVGTLSNHEILLVPPGYVTKTDCKSVATVTGTSSTEVLVPDGWGLVVLFTTSSTAVVTYTQIP